MIANAPLKSRDIHSCNKRDILTAMNTPARVRISEWAVLLLLAISILWKGGKGLEMVWLLGGLGASLTVFYWLSRSNRRRDTDRPLETRQGLILSRGELPLWLWAVALLYIGWTVLSYLFSTTSNYGVDDIIRSSGYVFLFLWVARLQIEQGSSVMNKWYPTVVAGAATVAAVVGIGVYILQPVNRFVGSFFDYRFHTDYWPNAWAEFLLLAWPMALLLAWRMNGDKKRFYIYAVLGLLFSTLFLSYSRGAFIAMAGQCVMALILFTALTLRDIRYRRLYKTIIRSLGIKFAAVLVTALLLFAGINALRSNYHSVQSISEKVTFTAAEGRSSIDERAQFWQQANILAHQRPLVGWGPYSFRFVQPQYMKHVLATSDHPHNALLKLSMERGYPLALLFAVLFGSVMGISILSFFTTRKSFSAENDAFTMMCITSITGVLLHNVIDYNLQFTGIGIACILCLGLLVRPAAPVMSDATVSFRRWKIRKYLAHADVILACGVLALCLWEGTFLVTSSLGRHAMAAGDYETALQWFGRSHYALFTRDLYLSEAQLFMQKQHLDDAEKSLERYEEQNAFDPRLWKLRGEVYLRREENDRAVTALSRAYDLGKYTDLGILRLLLESMRRNGKLEEYVPRKHEFDSVFSAYADAIEENTHFIALSQNVEELQAVSRILSQMYPIDEAQYKAIARSALNNARMERDRFAARTPGMLW